MLVAENLFNGVAQCVVAAAAAIGFIAAQHGGLHILRDRAGAAVGQQVDKDIFAIEQERVHA